MKRKVTGVRKGNSTNTCIHAFSFLLAKHREPQRSSANPLLPIISIAGINQHCRVRFCAVVGQPLSNSCMLPSETQSPLWVEWKPCLSAFQWPVPLYSEAVFSTGWWGGGALVPEWLQNWWVTVPNKFQFQNWDLCTFLKTVSFKTQ